MAQKKLDESGFVGTILMDLSKAYDCLPYDGIVAKLEAYGLAKESLQLMSDYLSYHKQRTETGPVHSHWVNVIRGIPQGSILSPLLFNNLLITFSLLLKSQTFKILQMARLGFPIAATCP